MKILFENIKLALESVRINLLRTILTVLIIAFGIMALVGILTSIDAIEYYLTENFALMGSNTFNIKNRTMRIQIGKKMNRQRNFSPISFDEALTFKEEFNFAAHTSVHTFATHIATLKYKSEKTNPNVTVIGTDENYLTTSGYEIAKGRNFTINEVYFGAHVVIIGSDKDPKKAEEASLMAALSLV